MNMIYAKYTEVMYNLLNNAETKALIDNAMSTYPLYVSTSGHKYGAPNIIPTRAELNKRILDYYKYREIGFETVGRFLDELEISLNEIMPYYNQLFYSADQDYNMVYNVDYKRTIERELDGTNSSDSTGSNTNNATVNSTTNVNDTTTSTTQNENKTKNVRSDTPQNQLSITNQNIDTVDYASEASWNKDNTTGSANTTGTSASTGQTTNAETGSNTLATEGERHDTETTLESTFGNYGVVSAQDLVLRYRETIINIVQQIINDPRIAELFMLVY